MNLGYSFLSSTGSIYQVQVYWLSLSLYLFIPNGSGGFSILYFAWRGLNIWQKAYFRGIFRQVLYNTHFSFLWYKSNGLSIHGLMGYREIIYSQNRLHMNSYFIFSVPYSKYFCLKSFEGKWNVLTEIKIKFALLTDFSLWFFHFSEHVRKYSCFHFLFKSNAVSDSALS